MGCPRFIVATEEHGITGLAELQDNVNEMYIFHGTNPTAANSIARTGFDMSQAWSARGTMFGPGIYCAENASKSDEYAGEGEGIFANQCALLICRAAAGSVCVVEGPGDYSDR